MIIGVLKERRAQENRVSMTPEGVEIIMQHGHRVLVEVDAGKASGLSDEAYIRGGAEILEDPKEIFQRAEMILGVREPQPSEYGLIREDHILLSFLHLAASEDLALSLLKTGALCIAYETIQRDDGSLPLLTPMSEIAGPMAIQEGAKYLEMAQGGHGVLLGGVPGVDPGTVVIIGGGVVGLNAAKMACGLGAKVYVLDKDLDRLRYLSDVMPRNSFLLMSSPATIRKLIREADVVVGAVLVPGKKTPKLITRDMLKEMQPGTVLVDVSIDQGGCFETSKETTHSKPTYTLDGIVHYAVGNMPGAVPKTSTIALANVSLHYVLEIANRGWKEAIRTNRELARGANILRGHITSKPVADSLGREWVPLDEVLTN
ncbi:MAG: alanine dehydrogenase [Deltaproteobacteria bacterium]|nr:alanine dehydrogenase [Deltaproteobacteria bacterium]